VTKLIIQIPCLNEAESLANAIVALPRSIPGIDVIEFLVIDDGSTDDTSGVARRLGVHHIVRHRRNRGLAAAFQTGLNYALNAGADILVNTDADGQYEGADIAKLVQPIGFIKRRLQRLGSAVVRYLSKTDITDAVSGFRAISREAAQRITITTEFSYTTDMLIQTGRKRLKIVSVPVRTHLTERPSRLFRSIPQFITLQLATMVRVYATYNPLRTFALIGLVLNLIGLMPIARFMWFWLNGQGDGHIQSLVLGGALIVVGTLTGLMGLLADLIGANRKLHEAALQKLHRIEDRLVSLERANERAATKAKPEKIAERKAS